MKSFLMKLWYSCLAIFALLIVVGLIGETAPLLAVSLFIIGVPTSLYLIFKKSKEQSSPVSTENKSNDAFMKTAVRMSGEQQNTKQTTINIDDTSYDIPVSPKKRSKKKVKSAERFISQDENFHVRGYDIGGLVYVGSPPKSRYHSEVNPALIDPSLNAKKTDLADPLGYWPDYTNLDSAQRNRYLSWLSSGRGDIDELGYVFLYFYGFEKYVLQDANKEAKELREKNIKAIVSELHRLRELFASNNSFNTYSNQLLDVIYVVYWPDRIDERKEAFPNNNPVAAQFAISQMAHSHPNELLDSDWALHWLIGIGPVSRTKAVRENYPLLRSLFKEAYERSGGIKVPSCKTKLRLDITPAAMGLYDYSELGLPDNLCNPTGLKRPMSKLTSIGDEVLPILRKLSKAMNSHDVATMLSVWPQGGSSGLIPELDQVIARISVKLEESPFSELRLIAELMDISLAEKATKTQLKQISSALQGCGFILVPDPLLTPATLKASDQVVAYKGERPAELSPEGLWVALSIHLGSLLAIADGEIHETERATLHKIVNSHPNRIEREYLSSYVEWRLGHPPSTTGLKKQIEYFSESQKKELAQLLVNLALADGELPASEIKQLEKLFTQLGFAKSLVSELLHSSATLKPSTIVAQKPRAEKQNNIKQDFELDVVALQAHTESTKEIQTVLQKLFEEETSEEALNTAPEPVSDNDSWHNGLLDESHDALAVWLLTKDEWSMEDVAAKCQSLALLPDGALETINNAAFDTLGDSLLEIDDPVEVYRDVLPA